MTGNGDESHLLPLTAAAAAADGAAMRPRHARLRRRGGARLSPWQRGVSLLALFGLWLCIGAVMDWRKGEIVEEGERDGVLRRRLLQEDQPPPDYVSEIGNSGEQEKEKADEETTTPEVELDEIGERVIKDDESAYDKEGNLKPNECINPAIEHFPSPIMGPTARKYGGILFHIFLATYMFMGLAIVCDNYFVPALDRIADVLNLDPDVAGATFMAAGSSGPELATALIGVFVAKDDIGVSGVIGSAVFNITLVIAVCALAADRVFILNWWSVVRDCSCYLVSIILLLCTIANEVVNWYEAVLFLLLYVVYCVFMAFSSRVEKLVKAKVPVPESWNVSQAHASGVDGAAAGVVVVGSDADAKGFGTADANKQNGGGGGGATQMSTFRQDSWGDPMDGWGSSGGGGSGGGGGGAATGTTESTALDGSGGITSQDPKAPESHAMEPRPNPLEKPMDASILVLVKFYALFPLYFLAKYTILDFREPRFSRFFVATFVGAILWISLFSYVMVWMITVIGFTLGIPDTVMGLTFIAAGVSVPDALSGVAVVKEGHGDMAVSNAIGSNVFDILICLGFPWFLKTAIVTPGKSVTVKSRGLIYSTFSLFSTIIFLIVASHFNGWRLDRKFGIILLIWYFIFMVIAALYELNVFGKFNPSECVLDI